MAMHYGQRRALGSSILATVCSVAQALPRIETNALEISGAAFAAACAGLARAREGETHYGRRYQDETGDAFTFTPRPLRQRRASRSLSWQVDSARALERYA